VSDPTLHARLWRAADARPNGPAIVDGDTTVSYRELANEVRQLAAMLVDAGAKPGERVAVLLDKSATAIAALYAVLASGAAYVPLDPDAPASRIETIVRDCTPCALLTERTRAPLWESLRAVPHVITVDSDEPNDAAEDLDLDRARSSDLAYILYTSGSTGVPKGIAHTHESALAFVEWAASEFRLTPDDRVASHAPFHFDLSTFDLYSVPAAMATMVLVPRAAAMFPRTLRDFLREQAITVWYSVPWPLMQLAERSGLEAGELSALRAVLYAGEPFPVASLRHLMSLLPGARFANLYGPTECNVCTWHDIASLDDDADVPIGHPIAGVDALAVADDRVVDAGGVGELYVHGPTVMQGYWGDAARTAATLVDHPVDADGRGPWLRTGDLVEVLTDGGFRFRGRRDDQVKHRGNRVELGDVEAALSSHPAVAACAVVLVPDDRVGTRLVAFVSAQDTAPAESDLREACAQALPRYMVPDRFEFLSTLPRTSTGKTDRRALIDAALATSPSQSSSE
jgi:amino acid adenylation domain-containing protein